MTNENEDQSNIKPKHFIQEAIDEDLKSGRFKRIHTRFPPEPNGYPHIGHAKAISINFEIAKEYGGLCNLRFDDTNPLAEETEYVNAIKEDIRWLGYDWEDREYYASDYFEQLYEYAVKLIKDGKAYVDSLSAEEMSEYRGPWNKPGKNSPYRGRSVEENLDLFERMRKGEFADGTHTLRAKIDMASPNMNLRDPAMYRILKAHHHRTGDAWCIYPTYDWAHGEGDSIEGISHSLCSMEFENHRLLYDWFVEQLGIHHPRQMEFSRLNLTCTVMSKRRLVKLVQDRHVRGWDDPRMPTLRGMRRRGYTPEAIRHLCEIAGVTKTPSTLQMSVLENCLREDLNKRVLRKMAVLHPLRVVIENYPEGKVEELDAVNNPEDAGAGTRKIPFSRVIYIEQDDFMQHPPKEFFRLAPEREVRLRYAYFIQCNRVIQDRQGNITELRCTYDPETRGGQAPDGRKVKATIHWVSADHAVDAEVRLYDNLFSKEDPDDFPEGKDFIVNLNPKSLEILKNCKLELSLASATVGERFQFERLGYFCVDPDSSAQRLVFNRTVTLRDTWAKTRKG
ncbi:glutamine--tRNA ligase/YqeY domain fusion protein [Candidatus Acetothermia bacterium]|nr:glutamine--tRNA ligase/YqeY domain fusion protein [Candidatus Acetothermia bacterium]MBI3643721.1 glutamine--tRNA ligase/YqeY domain fusion protein [Candidatus Acetothermia bacterium]